jgi:hypothetical protein
MTTFSHLEPYAGDPILSLNDAFQKDPRPAKVNLSIGIYFDDAGRIPVLDCVRQAEAQMLAESGPKPYLPIEGAAAMRSAVQAQSWQPAGTEWVGYTSDHNYSDESVNAKRRMVHDFVAAARPTTVWDLGGNTGMFSRVAREVAESVVCFDIDPAAVEVNYREVRKRSETGLLPLQLDLMNPSPATGWAHEERLSLEERGPVDLVMALALVHHLAIANNIPLPRVADYFARLGRSLVIEFVPKSDSQVVRLLTNRADIFPDYTIDGFERAFERRWSVETKQRVGDSERTLYLMRRREV